MGAGASADYAYPAARLLIFTKAPRPGEVKTRLIPALGAEGAARLQATLTRRFVEAVTQARVCPVELWVAPDASHPLFLELARRHGLALYPQHGADLGERMLHACRQAATRGDPLLLAGTDCPGLTPALLLRALRALQGHDAVLNPAVDGGYVLLGLRHVEPALFRDMPWGSDQVAELTRERLRHLRRGWLELPPLGDIDRPEDLSLLDTEILA